MILGDTWNREWLIGVGMNTLNRDNTSLRDLHAPHPVTSGVSGRVGELASCFGREQIQLEDKKSGVMREFNNLQSSRVSIHTEAAGPRL